MLIGAGSVTVVSIIGYLAADAAQNALSKLVIAGIWLGYMLITHGIV